MSEDCSAAAAKPTDWFYEKVELGALNPWNVPDWMRPKNYRKFQYFDLAWWRWEFTRRNAAYRREWLQYQSDCQARETLDSKDTSKWERVAAHFGLVTMVSPCITIEYFPRIFLKNDNICSVTPAYDDVSEFCQQAIGRGQYLIAITPYAPLDDQWEIIKREIREWNAEFYPEGARRKTRLRHDKFSLYLRLLDARDASPRPSWATIAKVLKLPKHNRSIESFRTAHKAAMKMTEPGAFKA